MRNTVFLIGNGFNRFLQQCYSTDSQFFQDIDGLSRLWGRFEESLSPLLDAAPVPTRQAASQPDNTTERSAQLLYDMIRFAEGVAALGQSPDLAAVVGTGSCGLGCRETLNALMARSVFSVVRQFIGDEGGGLYSRIFQNPPIGFAGLQSLMASASSKLALFTTNYDGLVDMILGFEGFRGENTGFRLVDGFSTRTDVGGVYFRDNAPEVLSQWGVRGHLHGSYKFLAQRAPNGDTLYRKLGRDELRDFDRLSMDCQPVVVFDAPNRKKTRIDGFRILRQYLTSFEEHLEQAQNLVLFGLSLKDDPHLLECIRTRWLQSSTLEEKMLYIIDTDPEPVWNRVGAGSSLTDRSSPNCSFELVVPRQNWTFVDLREKFESILTR